MKSKYTDSNFKHDRLYDNRRWRTSSKLYLGAHPMCVPCSLLGYDTPAIIVHHKIEHKGNLELFWSESNWEPVCASCHSGHIRVGEHHGYSQSAGVDGLPTDPNHPWNKT